MPLLEKKRVSVKMFTASNGFWKETLQLLRQFKNSELNSSAFVVLWWRWRRQASQKEMSSDRMTWLEISNICFLIMPQWKKVVHTPSRSPCLFQCLSNYNYGLSVSHKQMRRGGGLVLIIMPLRDTPINMCVFVVV